MFKRHTEAEINRLVRESWLQTKARGRNPFIWIEMLASLPYWLIAVFVVPAVEALKNHSPFSVRSILSGSRNLLIDLILLAIVLIGGYLTGRWRWTDFEKKYPENSLPPWK
jgi:hypothetical protein